MFYKPRSPEIKRVYNALSSFIGFEWGWDLFFFEKIGYLWIPVNEAGMANIPSCEFIDSPEDLFKRCLEESVFTLLAKMNDSQSDFSQNAAEQKAAIRAEWRCVLKQLPEYAELFDQVLGSERTGIIQCARILLRNTDNDYLQEMLQDIIGTQYWNFDDMDLFRLSHEYDLESGACAEDLYSAVLESLPESSECIYLLYYALKRICEDGYNISGFGLVEIPNEDTFCFCNSETDQAFDMVAFNNDDLSQLQPGYLDLNSLEQLAPNIKTAIKKFSEHFRKYNSSQSITEPK